MSTDNKKEPNKRRGAHRGRGNRDRSRRSSSPVDPNAVPKLKHGGDNNFPAFKKKFLVAGLREFGNLARLIDLGAYFELDEINADEYDLD